MYKIRGTDQKEYGPVNADMVRQWIAEGRANSLTLVQAEGSAEWKPLSAFAEFSAAPAAGVRPPLLSGQPVPAPLPTAPTKKTSGLAISSLVLGIAGLFTCGITSLIGLICGIVSLIKIRNSQGKLGGEGLAIGGICASAIFLLMMPIFAAMLLPALAKAKNSAQSIQCVNNVKQLSLAVRIYANDHNERYPAAKRWCDDVLPFTGGSPKVFTCPLRQGQRCGYAFNQNLDGKKESEIDPSTVLIFESDGGWNAVGDASAMVSTPRHRFYTIGFADGHVEQVPASRLSRLRWEP